MQIHFYLYSLRFNGSSINKIIVNRYGHSAPSKFWNLQRKLLQKDKAALNLYFLQSLSKDGNCDILKRYINDDLKDSMRIYFRLYSLCFNGFSINKIMENHYGPSITTKSWHLQRNLFRRDKAALDLTYLQNFSRDGNCDISKCYLKWRF